MSKYVPMLKFHDVSSSTENELLQSETLYQQAISEIEHYSITPRTLRAKTFLGRNASDIEPPISKEEYEYENSNVVKFCINTRYLQTDVINNTLLGENVSFTPNTSNVSATTTGYTSAVAQASTLHPVEKDVLISAINDTNPIVLVDIFERTNGQSINLDSLNIPILHTVLVYKDFQTNKVFIVDPSNFLFSSHLANNAFNKELQDAGLPIIETIHKKIQIYKPEKGSFVGPDLHEYRDCSDLAVKLAFGFDKNRLVKFDKKSIEEHPVVVRLSNISTLDKSIFEEKLVARIKQSSSIKAQEAFSMMQLSIDQKLKMTTQTYASLNQKYKTEYNNIIKTPDTPSGVLKSLLDLDQQYNIDLLSSLDKAHQQLETANTDYCTELAGQTP